MRVTKGGRYAKQVGGLRFGLEVLVAGGPYRVNPFPAPSALYPYSTPGYKFGPLDPRVSPQFPWPTSPMQHPLYHGMYPAPPLRSVVLDGAALRHNQMYENKVNSIPSVEKADERLLLRRPNAKCTAALEKMVDLLGSPEEYKRDQQATHRLALYCGSFEESARLIKDSLLPRLQAHPLLKNFQVTKEDFEAIEKLFLACVIEELDADTADELSEMTPDCIRSVMKDSGLIQAAQSLISRIEQGISVGFRAQGRSPDDQDIEKILKGAQRGCKDTKALKEKIQKCLEQFEKVPAEVIPLCLDSSSKHPVTKLPLYRQMINLPQVSRFFAGLSRALDRAVLTLEEATRDARVKEYKGVSCEKIQFWLAQLRWLQSVWAGHTLNITTIEQANKKSTASTGRSSSSFATKFGYVDPSWWKNSAKYHKSYPRLEGFKKLVEQAQAGGST